MRALRGFFNSLLSPRLTGRQKRLGVFVSDVDYGSFCQDGPARREKAVRACLRARSLSADDRDISSVGR